MLSIPYDPALVLGNLVDETVLAAVLAVSAAGAPADNAQDALNSLLLSKRSIDMTIQELTGMGIDPKDVIAASAKMGESIAKAAVDYANATIKSQQDIVAARKARSSLQVSATAESPLDYVRTQIKQMPLAADSIKFDAQYFNNDSNDENSSSTVATISSYVSESTSFLGDSYSSQATASAQRQAASQYSKHDIAGTLVITAGCTHKNALLLAPLVIDPDKAIRVWNMMFPKDQISTDNPKQLIASVMKAAANPSTEAALKIISGATYGSSFVGMVHVLNTTTTQSSQELFSTMEGLSAQMTAGLWFGSESGGVGVNGSFANSVKNLLSLQQIKSHCSLVVMGSIPSIKSNDAMKCAVKSFNSDPKADMESLVQLQNATQADSQSVSQSAEAARTGGQMTALAGQKVTNALSGLATIDEAANKMIDINSMMTAFEDYVDKCLAGNLGVPLNYYLKSIPKSALAHLWVSKYYPQYLAISEDDSGRGGPAGGGGTTPTPPAS